MRKINPSNSDLKDTSLDIDMIQGWRGHYVDILVTVFALIACFGLASSIVRAFTIGWLDIFYIHILACALLIFVFLRRQYLSTNQKCAAIVLASFIGGLAGTVAFGLAGTGIIYVIHAAMFSAIFVNRRLALFIVGFLSVFLLAVGYLYSQGSIQAQVDLNQYVSNYSAWIATVLGPISISIVFVLVVSRVRANFIKALLQLEEAKSELREAALHDPLTGLSNLRHLNKLYDEHIKHMHRGDDSIAALVIDLDNFKQINDRYGHMDADKLLIEIAQRMKSSIRSSDTAARVGGDEFIVLLRNIEREELVSDIAKSMISRINAPFEIYPNEFVYQGASIGASLLKQETAKDLECLLKEADISMYKLKALGKNGFYLNDEHFFRLEKDG